MWLCGCCNDFLRIFYLQRVLEPLGAPLEPDTLKGAQQIQCTLNATSREVAAKIGPLKVRGLFLVPCNTGDCDVMGGERESVANAINECILS